MKPLSIALIRQSYSYHGGAELILTEIINALQRRNMRLTLLTRGWQDVPGVSVLACNPRYFGRLWRDWSFARAVCRCVEKLDVDLVQSHERIDCCDIYRAGDGVHRAWLEQYQRVLGAFRRHLLKINPYHRYLLRAEKTMFEGGRLRAVICVSRMVRDEIRENFVISPDRLHVIHNGVDTAKFHPGLRTLGTDVRKRLAIPPGATLFLFVGSGFRRKGLSQALVAFSRLPDTAHLLVVGKDKQSGAFARFAENLGVSRRTHFTGPREDVLPFYGAADALIFPTLYDPFGIVVLEAMASGLPVITSHKCGGAELIENGANGFVCDALDTEGLVASMRALLDPVLRQRMSIAARQTAEPLTLEAMGAQISGLYLRLLSGAGA